MRVTQGMLTGNMLRNVSNSYQDIGKYMEQLSTGKKINNPSDDPVVAMKGMNYRTQVKNTDQYERNINEVHTWMDNSDDAMDKAQDALDRLRELAVQGSNDTYEEGQRGNIASEVEQLRDHLLDVANTKVNNKYIFSGTQTTGNDGDEPYQINGDDPTDNDFFDFNGNSSNVNIEVSDGVKLPVNVTPDQVFTKENAEGNNMFETVTNFANDLRDGASGEDLNQYIAQIDEHIDDNVNARADLGARQNRIELIEDRVQSQGISAEEMMSDNEDADMEKVIMKLTSQESVHRAALSAGARVIQPTLMDFLR
ncbi:flagellar hook-associated protein FlgL [Gracilibacillus halophilus YIM-C55.5]|uniref:Flagellar hook-associated protein FlgL n=1 Tax=Gracilibacillus halophilus YIM-C55.5 TaxID=1308866 RepID=N4WDP8_9BACI|nr:flagellar hook-associated protein FlgL [Gracilibacillus halophilus]ENH98393.1 flagellar hook-associated protein FlgL [Gracilibacillus halophilus YIM-C55.5]